MTRLSSLTKLCLIVIGTLSTITPPFAAPAANHCSDARATANTLTKLSAALEQCFREQGNHLRVGSQEMDRGTALQRLHVERDAEQRRAIFHSFLPLWDNIHQAGDRASPYPRLIAMAAEKASKEGQPIDVAAKALGVPPAELELWLIRLLEAWRATLPAEPVEPWDYRYANSSANRLLDTAAPADQLLPVTKRYFQALGADLNTLEVQFELEPAPDKSPLAYTDFRRRGGETPQGWQRQIS